MTIEERNQQFTPTVTYLSGYAGTTKKCWFKCDCCGNEWETLPKTIYTGRGCPKCGSKKASDNWHGNPNKHKPDDYNTIAECAFGELY